jgi:hypothetical protein
MFGLVLVKNMKKKMNKGGGSREGGGAFISNINHQNIEN